jgi:hypothetical protein
MRLLPLATVLGVRGYKQHRAEKARLEPYDPELANLGLPADYSENEIAYLQQQANGAYAPRTGQGFCGRQYRDCTTCGRVNASNCHQRQCSRRQRGRSCCCGGKRRARQSEAVRAVPRETEVAAQEEGVADCEVEKRDSGYHHVDNKSVAGFKASAKEVEARDDDDDGGSQVEKYVELPPYKRG